MNLMIYFSAENIYPKGHYQMKMAVRRAVEATLAYEGFAFDTEISVTFCDNEAIRVKNAEYRGKDSPTDVLSFPMYERDELEEPWENPVVLGDIVISLERAAEQAESLGHSTEREVAFLTAHSVLHLLGYDHERSKEEDEDMCRRQRDVIRGLYDEKQGEDVKA